MSFANRVQKKIGGETGGAGCDECTGGLVFAWHFENNDVTLANPCGCSILGDTVAGAGSGSPSLSTAGWYSDGSYAGHYDATGEHHVFDITQNGVALGSEGRIEVDFSIDTWADNALLVELNPTSDGDSFMGVRLDGSESYVDVSAYWLVNSSTSRITAQSNYSGSNGLRAIMRWKVSNSNQDLKIDSWELDDSTPVRQIVGGTQATAGPSEEINAMPATIDQLQIGDTYGRGALTHIDRVYIYTTSGL